MARIAPLVNDGTPAQQSQFDRPRDQTLVSIHPVSTTPSTLPRGPCPETDSAMPATSRENRRRSMSLSLPWRRPNRTSASHHQDHLRHLPQQLTDLEIDDEPANDSRQPHPRRLSGNSPPSASIKSIIRRASMSLRGIVHRKPAVMDRAIYEEPAGDPARPTTSYQSWNRLRHHTGLRHAQSFYGFNSSTHRQHHHHPAMIESESPHAHMLHLSIPGFGNDPPVIPHNSGAAAKAAAAMQNDYVLRNGFQTRWLHESDDGTDVESGIGIAVTTPEERAAEISRVDFVSALPAELAIHILACLDAAALAKASLVSRNWKKVITNHHIWRESCLRETTGTYATSGPIMPDTGLGIPKVLPGNDWKDIYRVKRELSHRWKDGKAQPVYLNGHTDSIYCLQFDEYKIITGSRDRTIRIWDMHTLECRLIIGPPEVVNRPDLLRDADGQPVHFASGFENEKRALSMPSVVSFPEHHNASILCLQYDDEILATGSSDASCILYDIRAGYRPIKRLQHHTAAVLDLAFDEKHIVTCSKDISICVWDRASGTMLHQLRGHTGPVNAVQMRGNTIVSCSGDFSVKLWNIDTGKNIREFVGHTKGLACSQFSEDGRYVASAGNDKAIRIWDANTGECFREMKAHDNLVRSLHIDSVSGRLVSGSYDTDIKVWDMETGQQLLDFPKWHASWVLSAKSDYRRIVSTGQDPKILIMDFGADIKGIDMLESGDRDSRDQTFI